MATSPIDLSAGLVPKSGGIDLSAGLVSKETPVSGGKTEGRSTPKSIWERMGIVPPSDATPPPLKAGEQAGPAGDFGGPGDALIGGLGHAAKEGGELYVEQGPHQMVSGAGDVAKGDIAKGGHKIISGGMVTMLPLMPEAIAANPLVAARAAAGGFVVGKGAELGTKAAGGNEDQQKFANDLGNLGGGFVAGSGLTRGLLGSPTRALANKVGIKNVLDVLDMEHPVTGVRRALVNKLRSALEVGTSEGTAAGPVSSEPAPAPYRMRGNQITDPITVTPRRIVQPRGLLTEGTPEAPAPTEPAPAPYRLRGNQIQDAATITPRRILGPERQLGTGEGTATGPVEAEPAPTITPLRATNPKTAQTEILRKAGVAAPAATIKPMTRVPSAEITPRPDLSFANQRSGEAAAMNQLTENYSPERLGINDLRGIAQSRGIKVNPGDKHLDLIGKIHDSLTPAELDRFEQAALERQQPDYSLPPTITRQAGAEPAFAFRSRDVGEEGIPLRNAHSQASMSEAEVRDRIMPHRSANPQEMVRVDLSKLHPEDYESMPGPNEANWVKFKRPLGEHEIELMNEEPRIPVDDVDMENLLMRSIKRAKAAKSGS